MLERNIVFHCNGLVVLFIKRCLMKTLPKLRVKNLFNQFQRISIACYLPSAKRHRILAKIVHTVIISRFCPENLYAVLFILAAQKPLEFFDRNLDKSLS